MVINTRPIGYRLFTDGVTRPVYRDNRGQFIEADGERVDGVWLVPEEDFADTPVSYSIARAQPMDGEPRELAAVAPWGPEFIGSTPAKPRPRFGTGSRQVELAAGGAVQVT